nr:hypothetical protein [Sphingomonas sp. OK281]
MDEKYCAQLARPEKRYGKGRSYTQSRMRRLVMLCNRFRIGDVVMRYNFSSAKSCQQANAEFIDLVAPHDTRHIYSVVLFHNYLTVDTQLLSEANAICAELFS